MNRMLAATAIAMLGLGTIEAQNNWVYYGQDQGGTRYSTLSQITTNNVATLQRAWTFHTGDRSGFFESTPLVIDSVMYVASGSAFLAIDAVTGQQIWKVPAARTTRRGVSYWPGDAKTAPRIVASAGTELFALDAKTGKAIPEFGDEGSVQLNDSMNSPAAIYKDLAITQGNKPWIRAFNVRTAKLEWTFNLIAQPGDPGHDTWEGESWKAPGGTNVWGLMSVDPARGLVFLPNSMPGGNDYYGGTHHGDNLYGTSVVALDAATGKLRWYRQLVHHDIWDYDLGAAPTVVDVVKNGRTIPAVAQITKMGLLFVLDEMTGEPVWGVEERAVPQTTAPGEKTSPTQPFPIKPTPLARNSIARSELAKVTPDLEAYCAGLWDKYKIADSDPYTPWNDKQDIVLFPGAIGGGNWNGVTFDKPLGLLITNVTNAGQWGHLELGSGGRGGRGGPGGRGRGGDARGAEEESAAAGPTWRKVTPEGRRFWDQKTMYSCAAPPWGELVAVSAKTGDIVWHVPLGSFDELDAKRIKTGVPSLGGAITTAGNLVFIGATVDSKFRAFDARNGKELWSDKVDAPAHAIPSTYLGRDGRQYVAIAAGGGGFLQSRTSDAVVAYALPAASGRAAAMPAPVPAHAQTPSATPSAASMELRALTEEESAALPPGDGRDAVATMCVPCHGVLPAIALRKTPLAWRATVDDMRVKGAKGTDAQADAAVKYLSEQFTAVDVNTATAEQLVRVAGFTPEEAAAIVAYRQQGHAFKSYADVRKVPGLDARRLADAKARLAYAPK